MRSTLSILSPAFASLVTIGLQVFVALAPGDNLMTLPLNPVLTSHNQNAVTMNTSMSAVASVKMAMYAFMVSVSLALLTLPSTGT